MCIADFVLLLVSCNTSLYTKTLWWIVDSQNEVKQVKTRTCHVIEISTKTLILNICSRSFKVICDQSFERRKFKEVYNDTLCVCKLEQLLWVFC